MADEPSASSGVRDDRNVCQMCGALENLSLCAGCRSAWYCSKDHQREDWKEHKRQCKSLKSTNPTSQEDEVNTKNSESANLNGEQSKVTAGRTDDTSALNTKSDDKQPGEEDKLPVKSLPVKSQTSDEQDSTAGSSQQTPVTESGKKKVKSSKKVKGGVLKNEAGQLPAITEEGSGERYFLDDKRLPQAIQSRQKSRMWRSSAATMAPERSTSVANSRDAYVDVLLSRFDASAQYVVKCLNEYGICVLDSFLGDQNGEEILNEVTNFKDGGKMRQGEVVHAGATASGKIRGDIITWISGHELNCENIRYLVSCMDAVVLKVSSLLERHVINERTKAMVACYPGKNTGYLRHVDNPNEDGRCITCIYYLNKDWNVQKDGGLLKIYPQSSGMTTLVADIEPMFDRIVFFWSDRRNPHEVLPALRERFAITVWYYEAKERARALKRHKARGGERSVEHAKKQVQPLDPSCA
ncbi:hypothetical protein ACOMHN_029590 [Nucella lapillus]